MRARESEAQVSYPHMRTVCVIRETRHRTRRTTGKGERSEDVFVYALCPRCHSFSRFPCNSNARETPKTCRPAQRSLDDPRHRLPRVRPFDHLWTRTGAVIGALRTQALEARAQLALGLARLHELLL